MSDYDRQDSEGPDRIAVVKELERVYDGWLKVDRVKVSHPRFDGTRQTVVRESLERGDAAAVILLDKSKRMIWLVEQFRYPVMGNDGGWISELPAGVVLKGEDPDVSAAREVAEETGFVINAMEHVSTFYVSPGGSSERIFLYLATVEAGEREAELSERTRDVDEDIKLIEMSVDEFLSQAQGGRMQDAKTLIGGLWLLANRERIGI